MFLINNISNLNLRKIIFKCIFVREKKNKNNFQVNDDLKLSRQTKTRFQYFRWKQMFITQLQVKKYILSSFKKEKQIFNKSFFTLKTEF